MGLSTLREPLPRVHDEFSYLLAADTFAHGRLSNLTHPMWAHFETFHVLQTPRYASKYPPAQGLLLALGKKLCGRPIVGAWLGVALGCAAVCWMLQGWTRPRWALLGGVLIALHHGIHGGIPGWGAYYSWSQSFWGGGPALLGGSLVLGALPRIVRRGCPQDALFLGAGLVILANSRPFEGLLVSLPVLLALGIHLVRSPGEAKIVAPPFLFVMAVAAAGMARYNHAVTGSVARMPYAVYEATYNPAPLFVAWQEPSPGRLYRHDVLTRFFNEFCTQQWACQRTADGWCRHHAERLNWLRAFLVGPLLVPLLMLPAVLRRGRCLFAAVECVTVVLAHLMTFGILPHYVAPVLGSFMLLVVEGWRRLLLVRYGSIRIGRMVGLVTLLMVLVELAFVAYSRMVATPGWEAERARLDATLRQRGARHLVVVRYGPEHVVHDEWVYDEADIDASAVVWAREMDPDSMRRLLFSFPDRHAWLLEADVRPPRLSAYRLPPTGSP
jgi:hypothetical protein